MARIYARADGTLIGVSPNPATEALPAPPGATSTLVIDEDTNAALLARINADWAPFRLTGSTLTENGTPVSIAATSVDTAARERAQQAIPAFRAGTLASAATL